MPTKARVVKAYAEAGVRTAGQIRTGHTWTNQIRTGHTRTGQIPTGQTRTGQTWTGRTRTGQTRTGRTGQTRTGQARTGRNMLAAPDGPAVTAVGRVALRRPRQFRSAAILGRSTPVPCRYRAAAEAPSEGARQGCRETGTALAAAERLADRSRRFVTSERSPRCARNVRSGRPLRSSDGSAARGRGRHRFPGRPPRRRSSE